MSSRYIDNGFTTYHDEDVMTHYAIFATDEHGRTADEPLATADNRRRAMAAYKSAKRTELGASLHRHDGDHWEELESWRSTTADAMLRDAEEAAERAGGRQGPYGWEDYTP